MSDFYTRLAQIESGGNPNARAKTSSATGMYQMTRGTFDDLRNKIKDLGSYSWEQHAKDPAIQRKFAEALSRQNEGQLVGKGHEANDLNRYLAHFAGATGADRLLRSNPMARIEDVLGQKAAQANNMVGKSVGEIKDFFAKKLGVRTNEPARAAPSLQPTDSSNLWASKGPVPSRLDTPANSVYSLIPTALGVLAQKGSSPQVQTANAPQQTLAPTAPTEERMQMASSGGLLAYKSGGQAKKKAESKYPRRHNPVPPQTPAPAGMVPPSAMAPLMPLPKPGQAMPPPMAPPQQSAGPPPALSPLQQQSALAQITQQKQQQANMAPPSSMPSPGGLSQLQSAGSPPQMPPQMPQQPPMMRRGGTVKYAQGETVATESAPWNDYASAASTDAGKTGQGTAPWEDYANESATQSTKAAKIPKASKAGVGGTSFGEKARNFLTDSFSGAATALNTRPEQVSGNVLTGMKIREKTPQEEAKGPTRAAGRAQFWAGAGQGALVDPIAAVGQMVSPEGGKADRAIKSQMGGYEDFRKQLGGEGFDASRLAGNVASPFAIKGAGAVDKLLGKTGTGLFKRGATQGVLGGALQPVVPDAQAAQENAENPEFGSGFWGDKAAQVGTGAIAGGALNKLLGKAVLPASGGGTGIPGSPVERYRGTFPDADLTWGQHLGERANRWEQRAMSFPFVGDVIREARNKSLTSQNVGMMNKALGDAGLKLDRGTKSGRHMFDEAYNKLTGAYDNVLDDVSLTDPQALRAKIYGKMDTGDGKSLASGDQLSDSYKPGVISQKYNSLSEAGQQRFDKIMESGLFSKFGKDPKGNHAIGMTGKQFKMHEEDLKDTIDSLMHGGGEEREIGKMLKKALGEAYDSLQSSKPEVQNQLKKLNKSYAKYKTLETASTASSASEGVFTPAQTIRAASKGNRGSVSRGKGLLQNEAELSEQVLGKTYPDSGTAGRLQSGNLAKDLIGGALSLPLELAYSPKVAGAVLDGGGKAKRAFQGTRLGSKIASGAGQGVPATTRALLAPRGSQPEEEIDSPMARGGLVQYARNARNARYANGGSIVNDYLNQKVAQATLAQLAQQQGGLPPHPGQPPPQQPPQGMARGGLAQFSKRR